MCGIMPFESPSREVSGRMRRLGNPVRRRQQELGWSNEHAAYRVRIELERYLMIVNGNGNPEPDEIEKIVAEMALARNELLSWVRRATA
jgi:hypothetical protein